MARKKKIQKEDRIQLSRDDIRSGMQVSVFKKIRETNPKGEVKERIQFFEGTVLGRSGGKSRAATITVRKISNGIGVEAIFPIYSPLITKIELIKTFKTHQAKLYYSRKPTAKLREKKVTIEKK